MIAFLGILFALILLGLPLTLQLRFLQGTPGHPLPLRIWVPILLFAGLLFLRPHENTFQALDASTYRLMAEAFEKGRGFDDRSLLMQTLPQDLSHSFLYIPRWHHSTWDHVFEIDDRVTGATKPFLYPTLPLAMHGLGILLPVQNAGHYLVPILGWITFGSLLLFGYRKSGWPGALLSAGLCLATIFPIWFFRGYFPEALAMSLLVPILLRWLNDSRNADGLDFIGLGLAIVLHPVMLLWSIPVAGMLLCTSTAPLRRWLLHALVFGLAIMPLFLLTTYICQPYGAFDLPTLRTHLKLNPTFRFMTIGTGAALLALAALLPLRPRLQHNLPRLHARYGIRIGITLFLSLEAYLWAFLQFGPHHKVIQAGFHHFSSGIQLPFAVLLILCSIALAGIPQTGKLRLLAFVWVATLPVFLYLKGWDNAALWSQRRLLPHMILLILLPLQVLPAFLNRCPRRWMVPLTLLTLLPCLYVPLRWPAPYTLQFEKGADAFVNRMLDEWSGDVVLFDYHGYSIPFAAPNLHPVGGIGKHASQEDCAAVCRWASSLPPETNLLWMTAYDNPGIEEGVALIEEQTWKQELPRIRSKYVLPAEKKISTITFTQLQAVPATRHPAPVFDRILDGGFLGLRPPWGAYRPDTGIPGGKRVPTTWTREGSGLIGPIPEPGGSATITLTGLPGRDLPAGRHFMWITPPWSLEKHKIPIAPGFATNQVRITRTDTNALPVTGVYRIQSPTPWNPAKDGIRGYDKDLGMNLHHARIELNL